MTPNQFRRAAIWLVVGAGCVSLVLDHRAGLGGFVFVMAVLVL